MWSHYVLDNKDRAQVKFLFTAPKWKFGGCRATRFLSAAPKRLGQVFKSHMWLFVSRRSPGGLGQKVSPGAHHFLHRVETLVCRSGKNCANNSKLRSVVLVSLLLLLLLPMLLLLSLLSLICCCSAMLLLLLSSLWPNDVAAVLGSCSYLCPTDIFITR